MLFYRTEECKAMKKLISLIGNLGGIVSGIIAIVFAFNIKGMSIGSYESNEYYGGDAYTGIQQASAQAANNVQDLARIVRTGFFALFLVIGIALICFFITRLIKELADTAVPVNTGRSDYEKSVLELLTDLNKPVPETVPANEPAREPVQPMPEPEPADEQPIPEPTQAQPAQE